MKKIISLVGARPNFIKIAPLHKAFQKHTDLFIHKICHTGQHFDENMSKIFFDELELPRPDFYLGISGGSHTSQTSRIMLELEKVFDTEKPDLLIVPGDVNSTLAGSLVASKMGIPLAHVESGLRSFDRSMPEEINRMVTDILADYLFVSEESGLINLKKEGIPDEKVYFVGNIMIDSLVEYLPKAKKSDILEQMELETGKYILGTFHRPGNVDDRDHLKGLFEMLNDLAERRPLVFPIHPRTRKNMENFGLLHNLHRNILLTDPIGYIDFLALIKNAGLVITDSGGIQEETTFLGIPCVTVRDNTERPVTIEIGTNVLAGTDFRNVEKEVFRILDGYHPAGEVPELWDGHTAERIVDILSEKMI